ncbi:hypothetical protein X760_09975 [Mesorhizobium sp. LSHC422A00]|nr:hypothetical protein X760_09975 [Mesorhizobium sp. LSHC422A00]
MARSRGENSSPIMAKAETINPPPPIPCSTRAAIRLSIDHAMPQTSEPSRNRPIAVSTTFLRPYMSPSLP